MGTKIWFFPPDWTFFCAFGGKSCAQYEFELRLKQTFRIFDLEEMTIKMADHTWNVLEVYIYAIDTNAQALLQSAAKKPLQIGEFLTHGLALSADSGGNPLLGGEAVEESKEAIVVQLINVNGIAIVTDLNQRYHYPACSLCKKASNAYENVELWCNYCAQRVPALARVKFNIEHRDPTASIEAAVFPEIAEQFYGIMEPT
ncbi:hypothetical protein RHSIM_Rhsim11G0036000 [Rhododendron simsii]|uniref:Replication factor A C-terminal domain-containing protein n=1 Tax=Rhododendron simsii TaxID=118357 RepID=A0A834G6S3_RHOSS|nr:hypothetical protein RHSIM_Rhsim11G0036000 [Rhododendron simsii]